MSNNNVVCWLFRRYNRLNGPSIENVYSSLADGLLGYDIEIIKEELPCDSSSLRFLVKNIIYSRRLRYDLIHVTGDCHYVLPFLRAKKKILTIHDLGILHDKGRLKKIFFLVFWFYLPIIFSSSITVISRSVYLEVISLFPYSWVKDKLYVVPNPLPVLTLPPLSKNSCLSDFMTVLVIGSTQNKNLKRIFRVLGRRRDVKVIYVGRYSTAIMKEMQRVDNLIVHQDVDQERLEGFYRRSDVLLFPSLYEGFGLPILEAQYYGCNVITSSLDVLRWVGGPNCIYVNPLDDGSIDGGLDIAFQHRGKFIDHSASLKRFDRAKIVQKLISLYA